MNREDRESHVRSLNSGMLIVGSIPGHKQSDDSPMQDENTPHAFDQSQLP